MYELEIIRLLYLFAPNNPTVKEIVDKTLARLKTTCFGNCDDGVAQRLMYRTTYTNEVGTEEDITKYIENQQSFVDFANKSSVPTMIINTDDLNWDGYALMILGKIR